MRAVAIVNLHSGKNKNKSELFNILNKKFKKYHYELEIIITKYHEHAKEIMMNLDDSVDLVISVGGDGTFNEIVTGNFLRKKRLLVSHLPYGTTNDIGAMFGLTKNLEKNLDFILSGDVKYIDIAKINEQYFVYVAGFGRFMNIPYETPRKLKKSFGYVAYMWEAIKDFFQGDTHLYDLSYEVDGEKYDGLYSFLIISNANRIAGINRFYDDVKLDDGKLEVLFCNLKTKKDIVRSLFYLRTNDIRKVPGFYFHKVSHLKVVFREVLKKPWCIDGEKLDGSRVIFDISVIPNFAMLLPIRINKELFVNEK